MITIIDNGQIYSNDVQKAKKIYHTLPKNKVTILSRFSEGFQYYRGNSEMK